MSALEIAANAVITVSIWLAARNHVYTWPTGIVGCALFSVVFLSNQLYADATLQLFFIATSIIGWWQWFHPALPSTTGQRPITKARPQTTIWMVIAGIAVTVSYGVPSGGYAVEVKSPDGRAETLGTMTIDGNHGSWTGRSTRPIQNGSTIALVDASGTAVCHGTVPNAL